MVRYMPAFLPLRIIRSAYPAVALGVAPPSVSAAGGMMGPSVVNGCTLPQHGYGVDKAEGLPARAY